MRHDDRAVKEVLEVRRYSTEKIKYLVEKRLSGEAREGMRALHVKNELGRFGEKRSENDDMTQKGEGDRTGRMEKRIGHAVERIMGRNIPLRA